MKKIIFYLVIGLILSCSTNVHAQQKDKKIGFYGGFGLNLGTGYTYLSLQPGILYHFRKNVKVGVGVQYTYLKSNKAYYGVNFRYHILGYNTLLLYNPVKYLETSIEYENLYIKKNYNNIITKFWSPALFGGLGYHFGPVVLGFKYNFLYKPATSIYQDAFVPFIRIYF